LGQNKSYLIIARFSNIVKKKLLEKHKNVLYYSPSFPKILIWAHFRLRRKPGFAGVPSLRDRMATYGGPASLQSLAQ
jgi:hypothetical protein